MNYKLIYDQLIDKARSENRVKGKSVYYESHHIIPECMGGAGKERQWRTHPNIILLTAKEHFLAHKLLANIYGGKLWYALKCMMNLHNGTTHKRTYKITSREYEEAKIKSAKTHSKRMLGSNNPQYGTVRTEEHKYKLSLSAKGKFMGVDNPFHGKTHTNETKVKLSIIASNRKHSEETKYKIGLSCKGRKHSEDSKLKLSQSRNKTKREVYISGLVYESVTKASRVLNINRVTLISRLKSSTFNDYYYVNETTN